MGSPCLFTRQRALKMGYIYKLHVKNSNHHFRGMVTWKSQSFILKAKLHLLT